MIRALRRNLLRLVRVIFAIGAEFVWLTVLGFLLLLLICVACLDSLDADHR